MQHSVGWFSSRDSSCSDDPLSTAASQVDSDHEDDALSTSTGSSSFVPFSVPSSSSSSRRRRYLYPINDTVEVLHPEDIRWFYREVGDKRWTPFIGYDSLRIECQERELANRGGKTGDDVQADCIVVMGGLYEADVKSRKCYPLYWTAPKGKQTEMLRGTWFVETSWQPLDELFSEQIENEHLENFAGQKLSSEDENNKVGKGHTEPIHHLQFKEFHIDWYGVDRVYIFSEATASKFHRAVGKKFGLSKAGYGSRLCRGYRHKATMDDKPADITHLVFVVHGVGQKMESSSIIKSCGDLRENCIKSLERYMPDIRKDNKRAEFLPVEWRSHLRLDGDTVESITPNKVRGLRSILNSSAMDIMYYTSPLYRAEITQGLQTELNRLYSLFCSRHPYFEPSGGKVSVVAHSLGGVIAYDIMTGWNPIQLYDQYVSNMIIPDFLQDIRPSHEVKSSAVVGNKMYFTLTSQLSLSDEACAQMEGSHGLLSQLEEARQRVSDLEADLMSMAEKQHVKTPTLKFRVQNFFMLGSPLAVFLALRGIRPIGRGSQDHILPRSLCAHLFNIYHPADPVAYRLEPLIVKHYSTIHPVTIHRYDSPNKKPYDQMKPTAYAAVQFKHPARESSSDSIIEETAEKNENVFEQEQEIIPPSPSPKKEKSGGWKGMFARFSKKNTDHDELSAEMAVLDKSTRQLPPVPVITPPGDDVVNLEEETVEQTVQVQEEDLETRLDFVLREGKMESAYIAALTSHTAYWANQDIGLFVLSHLFPGYNPK